MGMRATTKTRPRGPEAMQHDGLNLALLSTIPRAVSVTSGKGGVGKTNIVTNLAVSLAQRGRSVLIIDCDLGLSNVDLHMGLNPSFNLLHALRGEKRLKDVLVTGPAGVKVLPAPFGMEEITALSREEKLNFLGILDKMANDYELIFFDTGAGISSNVMFFNMLANHLVVVMTPDPASMTDAYALIKVMATQYAVRHFHLLVNHVQSDDEGLHFYRKLTGVTQNFLPVSVDYLGCIPYDPLIKRSTMQCRTLVELYPESAGTTRFDALAGRLERFPAAMIPKENRQLWLSRFLGPGADETGEYRQANLMNERGSA